MDGDELGQLRRRRRGIELYRAVLVPAQHRTVGVLCRQRSRQVAAETKSGAALEEVIRRRRKSGDENAVEEVAARVVGENVAGLDQIQRVVDVDRPGGGRI